jgi:hypothetical protein
MRHRRHVVASEEPEVTYFNYLRPKVQVLAVISELYESDGRHRGRCGTESAEPRTVRGTRIPCFVDDNPLAFEHWKRAQEVLAFLRRKRELHKASYYLLYENIVGALKTQSTSRNSFGSLRAKQSVCAPYSRRV